MFDSKTVWVFSRMLSGKIDTRMISERNKRDVIAVERRDFSNYKEALVSLKKEKKATQACIFDDGRIESGKTWAFVKDGINRSGSNPLRKLGTSPGKQFLDVSNLYQVPDGQEGIVIISLGERFKEEESLSRESCSDLQELAIIANDLDFKVFGIVLSVAEKWDKNKQPFSDLCRKYGL